MEIGETVHKRRSIRNFQKQRVPNEIISKALEIARWSPSTGNTQPWEILVVSGEKVNLLAAGFCRKVVQQAEQKPDFPIPDTFSFNGEAKRRYSEAGKGLFGKMKIGRDDYQKRFEHLLNNCSGYGAPHFVFVMVDSSLGAFSILDVGIFVQTFCLAATSLGIGTCIMANLVRYPEVIRKIIHIPDHKKFLIGIAVGYPVQDDEVNIFRTPREEITQFVKWVE
jgi:nitroreductase